MRSSATLILLAAVSLRAAILPAGPGQPYPTPCAAIAAAYPGDTIEVTPGPPAVESCAIGKPRLTLRATGSTRAILQSPAGHPIWTIAAPDTTIEGFELHGATAGPAIHVQPGHGLTLRNSYLHHNQTGLLAEDAPAAEILIERTEFAHNTHNLDVHQIARLTLRFSYSNHAAGHLVRSRALETHLLYNRLTQESPTESPALSLSGTTYLIGNLVQSPAPVLQSDTGSLFAANNTLVSESVEFLQTGAAPALVRNNIFHRPGADDIQFVDPEHFDYKLRSTSTAVNAATASEFEPEFQYTHPLDAAPRPAIGVPDLGAFEYGAANDTPRAATIVTAVLALSSGYGSPGATTQLPLYLFTTGAESAATQWTLTYPAAAFTSVQVTPGPAATAAGKSTYCRNSSAGSLTCLLHGTNTTPIRNGIIANITFTLAPTTTTATRITLAKAVTAAPLGSSIPSRAVSGSVSQLTNPAREE